MKNTNVLIIGAGVAGLMAAYELVKAGKMVTVLEARNHTGGRIHTLNNERFFQHAELGAEFIHGDLPVTLALLKEANIAYEFAGGEIWQYRDGHFEKSEQFIENWDIFINKLNQLTEDLPIASFLDDTFPGEENKALRDSVGRYVSGYDTADPHKASALALRNEWLNEDEGAQHRLVNGYGDMVKYLGDASRTAGNNIILNSVVKQVRWAKGHVEAVTADGTRYVAGKLVIALPLGVLQAGEKELGAITFEPAIPAHSEAISKSGFGAIIKVLLEFDEAFWEKDDLEVLAGKSMKDMIFMFTDEAIPTWWTQAPLHSPLLTGWLGGVPAFEKKDLSVEELLKLSLTSLSNVFKIDADILKDKLIAWNIANWTADPFTRGSYAYDTVDSPQAREVLMQPVEDTLFFAGEYLYDGPAMGTVEAALISGKEAAAKILK